MYGDSLLVNPVTEPKATTRKVVLPAGNDWINFWTGQTERGGQTITADAPIDQMPIFVKAGSIIPMGPVVQSAADAADPLEIRIYGGKNADFQFYEDSGDGYAYEKGARATIHLHWDNSRNVLSIGDRSGAFPGMPAKHNFHIVLVGQAHGAGATEAPNADRSVTYEGHQMSIALSKPN
jgi:alpha-D-xyloside xylohydrolase